MSRYKAYPEYRDSGSDWSDSIPAHWDVKRISYISQLRSGDAIVSTHIEAEGDYPVYGGNGVRGYASSFNLDGDFVLIGRQGALCGNINYGSGRFWASEHAVVVYPSLDVNIKWLGETLRAMNLNQYNVSAAQPGLAVANIACLKIPFPPREQQDSIAAFLDHETAKIDALIEKQQRLIELLKEKRQAVISHAVTKGLNPNAPMKDSGVEWLGEVPAHWVVTQPRHVCSFAGGGTPSKDKAEFWEGDIPWVSPKDMKVDFIHSAQDCISHAAVENSAVKLIGPGALLIVVRGMILDHSVPVAIAKVSLTINQDMKALIPQGQLNGEYLLFCLKGLRDSILDLVESSAHGTKCLRTEQFDRMPLPLPPFSEQLAIANKLNNEIRIIDDLILKAEAMIELARERRTALISAAVTGKIDVRDWQPVAA